MSILVDLDGRRHSVAQSIGDAVRDCGSAIIDDVCERDLGYLARLFGRLGDRRVLAPRGGPLASPNSLSALHGRRALPFHTDGAARVVPPDYIILWSAKARQAATVLLDVASPELELPELSAAWVVHPGGGQPSFYTIPRRRGPNGLSIRFNPDCMRLASSGELPNEVVVAFASITPVRVEWPANRALLVDNSRLLHGREALDENDKWASLLRVEVHRE